MSAKFIQRPVNKCFPGSVKFEDIGGSENTLKDIVEFVHKWQHPEWYKQLGASPPSGFLLHGPSGCGKTLFAQAVAGELSLPILKVSAPDLVYRIEGKSEQKLQELFEHAKKSAPYILFLDELEAITPKRESSSEDVIRRIVAQLCQCMDDLNSLSEPARVLIIGATNKLDSLDPSLRRPGRFYKAFFLGIPDEGDRLKILMKMCHKLKLPGDFNFAELAHLTQGFVAADMETLCLEATETAINRIHLMRREQSAEKQDLDEMETLSEEQLAKFHVLGSDFLTSLPKVKPSAKWEGIVTVPNVTWENVGALKDIKKEIDTSIMISIKHPEIGVAMGVTPLTGFLLAGPPGCGKTLLAKAVANESGLNFIYIKGPELLNKYVDEDERVIHQVFQRARRSAPCILFFDGFDGLCPRRSVDVSGAEVHIEEDGMDIDQASEDWFGVVNQLCFELDSEENCHRIFIMAASNRPDKIDPTVLRPGRLEVLHVGIPTAAERHSILLAITKNGTKPPLDADVNLEGIANDPRCESFTGADLFRLVQKAFVYAVSVCMSSPTAPADAKMNIKVSKKHFDEALSNVKPSVTKKYQRMYNELKKSHQKMM